MSHHKIIHNPEAVKAFSALFIPEQKHHAIVFYTFSRRKYWPDLPKSEYLINRTILPGQSSPDRAYRSLLKLECPVGSYTGDMMNNGEPYIIPNNSTIIYCLIRPKDTIKALAKTLTYCVSALSGDTGTPMLCPYGLYKKEIGTSGVVSGNKDRLIQIN